MKRDYRAPPADKSISMNSTMESEEVKIGDRQDVNYYTTSNRCRRILINFSRVVCLTSIKPFDDDHPDHNPVPVLLSEFYSKLQVINSIREYVMN